VISVRIKAPQLTYQRHYFADRPHRDAAPRLVEFSCCRSLARQPLFSRRAEHTKLIELRPRGSELIDTLPKQCRYEIRRAERDGVACTTQVDFREYFTFHTEFCRSKDRPAPSWQFLTAHREHLLITKAMLGTGTLAMHAHLVDPEASRCRLFTSSSLFRREKDSAARGMIGRANRYLHYWDMQQMAARGLEIYDFGGYAPDTADPSLVRLNEFKDSFGGKLAQESTYVSLPLALSRQALSLVRRATRSTVGPAGVLRGELQPESHSGR